MSASWIETLRQWRRERLPHRLFVPAAGVLVLASAVGQELTMGMAGRLVWAWAAVAILRLWDDLEDRDVDLREHPGRVVLGASARPLSIGVVVGLGVLALWRPALLVLVAALWTFYRLRSSALDALLLLKYPVLVGVLRGAPDRAGWAAALLVYGGMLLDGDYRGGGAGACILATLLLVSLASFPGAVVLILGLALPWTKPRLGRVGVLGGVGILLLTFHLLVTA